MGTKKGGGRVGDLTTRVLIDIRDGIRTLTERVDDGFAQVDARLAQVDARLAEVTARIDQTNSRLDNLIGVSGDRWRDLDARVRKLEKRFGT